MRPVPTINMNMEQVFGYIDNNRDGLIGLTKELVSIATVNPPGENYEKIVSILERRCRRLKLATRRIAIPAGELNKRCIKGHYPRINLLARWDLGRKRLLHINGHYDVVPATRGWKTNPFKPVVRSGRIYGRGTEDMKGNIACTLMAIEALKACKIKPGCDIELSFTPDEETGGGLGFGYLVGKGLIKPDYAIGEGYHDNFISYGNKGLLWLKVEVRGKSCHSSEPHKGINSFEKMLTVANELMRLKKIITKQRTRFNTKEEAGRYPTMVMGGELWGGSKVNVVSDRSVFTIDFRLIPEQKLQDVKAAVFDTIERLKKKDRELKVKIYISAGEEAVACSVKNRLFEQFSGSIKKVLKKKANHALLSGATDMRFLIRKGIPCAGYAVDGGNSCHCDNEYVKIKSMVDTAKIFADVIANIK